MKNLKYVIIAALAMFVLSTYAGETKPDKTYIKISLENAIKDPGLVKAMYRQIPESFIKKDKPYYIAVVNYRDRVYLIYGSQRAWELFFLMDPAIGREKMIFHE